MPRTYGPPTYATYRSRRRAAAKTRRTRYGKSIRSFRRGFVNYNALHSFKRTVNWADENTIDTNLLYLTSPTENIVFSGGRMVLTANPATAGSTHYWAISYKFNLQNILNLNEFTNLFDSYRIDKVQLKIMPYASVMAAGTASVGVEGLSPIAHYVIDHDDNTVPTASEVGIAQLHEYAGYKRKRVLNDGVTITFKPSAQGIVFDQEATNSMIVASELKHSTWFDSAAPGVDHYGLKMIFEAVTPSANQREVHLRCETTYFLTFKTPR